MDLEIHQMYLGDGCFHLRDKTTNATIPEEEFIVNCGQGNGNGNINVNGNVNVNELEQQQLIKQQQQTQQQQQQQSPSIPIPIPDGGSHSLLNHTTTISNSGEDERRSVPLRAV